ncbi:MAG TPA: M48 family metalloprotease [Burkholderiales bacterium]|nr:M48 family metalloprotease [Burkholderiales bacterium]
MSAARTFLLAGAFVACPVAGYAECASLEALQTAAEKQRELGRFSEPKLPPASAAAKEGASALAGAVTDDQLAVLSRVRTRLSAAARLQPRFGICTFDVPNAIALAPGDRTGPTGAIVFSTGLLKLFGSDEAAIATVFAHEIAHLIEEHAVQAVGFMRQNVVSSATAGVRAALESGNSGIGALAAKQVFVTKVAEFQRELERKADATGYELYISARYDPRDATRALQKLREARGEGTQSYLSSHPGVSERIGLVTDLARDDVLRVERVESSRALAGANAPYLAAAGELAAAGNWRQLSALVSDWLRAVPGSSAGWYYKGLVMKAAKGTSDAAWEAFEKSVTLDPSNGTAWLELAKALWGAGFKAESVACASAMQGMRELEDLRDALPDMHILLHGRANSPQNLWWSRTEDGSRLITNDRQVLESRGLPADRIPPPWVPAPR